MPKLKVLSGEDVLRILRQFGFLPAGQCGSHLKVSRVVPSGARQSLTIPLHREIDHGTLMAMHRQALRFVPEEELRVHFFW